MGGEVYFNCNLKNVPYAHSVYTEIFAIDLDK